MKQALGMIETKGLVALVEATDAMRAQVCKCDFCRLADGGLGHGNGLCRRRRRGCESGHGRRSGKRQHGLAK